MNASLGNGVELTIWMRREAKSIIKTVQYVTKPRHVQTFVVKESAPAIAPQWARRNICHEVGRSGAGGKLWAFKNPRNSGAIHVMAKVLQGSLDPRVPPRPLPLRHPDNQAADVGEHPTTARAQPRYVHFLAMSCRWHRSSVSGVTIAAIPRNARPPTRCARAASRRRSSSVSRRRRPPNCRRKSPA